MKGKAYHEGQCFDVEITDIQNFEVHRLKRKRFTVEIPEEMESVSSISFDGNLIDIPRDALPEKKDGIRRTVTVSFATVETRYNDITKH